MIAEFRLALDLHDMTVVVFYPPEDNTFRAKAEKNYSSLAHTEFDQCQQHSLFALNWQSHQTGYGIGIATESWLRSGDVCKGQRLLRILALG